MNRRYFLSTALTLSLGALALGCGGGGGSPSSTPAGRGAAEGVLFVAANGALRLFASAAEGVAAGLTVASGVRAQIVGGPAVTVGSDGRLRLAGIEPGLRILRLSAGGSTRDIALTVVPNATLPLGETPVSRQAAVDAVRAFVRSREDPELLQVADVLASSTPLPAGVTLRPALTGGDAATITLERASWLVYVDCMPESRFGHDTVIALVDAQSGTVQAHNSLSWPVLNGANFYAENTVNATSPDAVQVATRRANGPVVASARKMSPSPATRENCRAADPDSSRTHVLMIQGGYRPDFAADMDNVDLLLSATPFPKIGTLKKLLTFEEKGGAVKGVLREFAAVRDACKSGDTFVLFVTAHGDIDSDAEDIAASYKLHLDSGPLSDGSGFRTSMMSVTDLDFGPCKACRIVLWIDTCYSGNWIPLLQPRLESLPDKDILILTSANQRKQAVAQEYAIRFDLDGQTYRLPPGGLFTVSLLDAVRRVQEISPAETGTDALAAGFPGAIEMVARGNRHHGRPFFDSRPERYLQMPQLFRPLEEGDVCGQGNQETIIK